MKHKGRTVRKGTKKRMAFVTASNHKTKKPRYSYKKHLKPTYRGPRLFSSAHKREQAIKETQEQLEVWHSQTDSLSAITRALSPDDLGDLEALDDWQKEAYNALLKGNHVVVDAPTTAGKTRVVETFLAAKFAESSSYRACYTCPVKSLANDKLLEMRALFGDDKVGINTGDIKHNLDAPLIIATLESYRNSLLGLDIRFSTHLVILDEYHYIQDFSRGSAWEEAIILSDAQSQLLLLSASVANSKDFAHWIKSIHAHPTTHVQTHIRPVPLKHLVFDHDAWVMETHVPQASNTHDTPEDIIPYSILVKALQGAQSLELMPCLVYTGKRLACERLAKVFSARLTPLAYKQRLELSEHFEKVLREYNAKELCPEPYRQMLVHTGVAYHHSGLPPPLRVSVESLVKQGALRICVATSGLSLGINFSVRSAMIADGKRPGDKGMIEYPASDILQMLGRAGRRGRDLVGYSLWPTYKHYRAFAGAQRVGITPRLKYDPSTFLGLLEKGMSLATIETLYRKSFQYVFAKEHRVKLLSHERLHKYLSPPSSLPCKHVSSMHHYQQWKSLKQGLCGECPHRGICHPYIKSSKNDRLSKLHHHLHSIKAVDETESLTPYGRIAKHFPHPGGLYIAKLIASGYFQKHSLVQLVEVMASFGLAFYKSIHSAHDYHLPVNYNHYKRSLAKLYPTEIFPHLYDIPFRGDTTLTLIDCNPQAGYLIKRWIMEDSWSELIHAVCHRHFASGDVFSLIYKTANYLQSLAQAGGSMSQEARDLREHLLRPPLDYIMPLKEEIETSLSDDNKAYLNGLYNRQKDEKA